MKRLIFLVLTCYALGLQTKAQQRKPLDPLSMAHMYLDENHPYYNPAKAVEIYKGLAEKGEADGRTMNRLAILYSEGVGTATDQEQAFYWFKKAAEAGHKDAWYNVATMYRKGMGVTQNFTLAYESVDKGAALNSVYCLYLKGYMLYKGLGCQQSYPEAIQMFRKSIPKGGTGSMYLLGLCFRNGYGITQNTDSARYWLNLAVNRGYRYAKEEMMETEPEFKGYQEVPAAADKKRKTASISATSSNSFTKVKHGLNTHTAIGGKYTGYLLKYDWSGQHIIAKSKLDVQLSTDENGHISGVWTENDSLSTPISAILNDSALVFSHTTYQKVDHYSGKKSVAFEFKNASLQLIQQKDSVNLLGNIQLWSTFHNEPEKPMYVSLVKAGTKAVSVATMGDNLSHLDKANIAPDLLTVYPNPFEHSLSFNLNLLVAQQVNVTLSDMNGKVLYQEKVNMSAGQQSHTLRVNVTAGTYVLKLDYNGFVKSAVVVKQ